MSGPKGGRRWLELSLHRPQESRSPVTNRECYDQLTSQGSRGGVEEVFGGRDLSSLRAAVAAYGRRLGLPAERVGDLLLIAHEMASNAIRHGGGRGRLRLSCERNVLRCAVDDWGRGFDTARGNGKQMPAPGASHGRGLWLIRQLADHVEIQSGPRG